MPANSSIDYGENDEVRIELIPKEERDVYFVGEKVEFDLRFKNNTSNKILADEEDPINVFLGFGSGTYDHVATVVLEGFNSIPPGEEVFIEGVTEELSIQGNGIIAIRHPEGALLLETEEGTRIRNPPKTDNQYTTLYSFTIWDENFYNLHYNEPKQLQKSAVRLSKYIVGLAAVQIVLVIFQLSLLIYQLVS